MLCYTIIEYDRKEFPFTEKYHLLVLFFSTNTIFSLFISFISTTNFHINKDSEYFSLRQIEDSHMKILKLDD